MRYFLTAIVLCACVVLVRAQDNVETFYAIRLEDPTTNQAIELKAPTGATGYSLTFPASLPSLTLGQSRALMMTGGQTGLVFGTMPAVTGSAPGVAFFATNDELSTSADFGWSTTQRTLQLANGTTSFPLLTLTKSGTPNADVSALQLNNTATANAGSFTKRGIQVNATGSWTGTVVGMEIAASGGTNNYAAIFSSGNVGIGSSTPNSTLQINGDISYSEFNYTTAMGTSVNNMDFTGNGNKAALVRIGPQTNAVSITGLAGGVAGKTMTLINASGQPISFLSQNASSTASNRFITPGDDAIVIPAQSTVTMHYSNTDSRWFIGAVSPLNFTGYPLTEATISATQTVLPTATASYIKITNNSGNRDVTLENGVASGQVLIIQNNNSSVNSIRITGANVEASSSDSTIQPGQALFLVWDGTVWQTVSAKS